MKRILTSIIVILIVGIASSQAPQKMTYQAVVRDAGGNLITNSNVGIRVSLLQSNSSGPVVYSETHNPLSNANGLVTFEIGSGVVISGSVATIDWSNGPYFIKTEVDPAGGTSYSILSTHQLLSVPYALYAETAGNTSTPSFLYARKKNTIQSVSSATNTQVNLYDGFTSADIAFNTSTGVATFNKAGVFLITAQVSFDAGSNAGRKLFWINCTSLNWPVRIAATESDGVANRLNTSFVGSFNVGDQVSLGVAQFTGLTVDCPSNTLPFDMVLLNIELIR